MKVFRFRMTFTEELLGTSPADPELYRRFIGSKGPDADTLAEEVAALGDDAVAERGMTVFPRTEEGEPFIWDYQLKGFCKDACAMLRRTTGTKSGAKELRAYKKCVDGLVFFRPRRIVLHLPEGAAVGRCERPLRASTAQGERVALASSESVPAGTWCDVEAVLMADWLAPAFREWLQYGAMRGIGQWRNSGKGAFRVDSLKVETRRGIGSDEDDE
jgi:hypothetical protein